MRSTSIFLLITSVLTFSFSAFTASAEDAAMHHHTMSSMADMPEMKKRMIPPRFIRPAGSLKPGATMPS
jgi:hypothetical protein